MKLIKVKQPDILKAVKYLVSASLIVIFMGCEASFGEKYTLGNLEIYYTQKNVGEHYVEAMGEYFRDNELIQDKKHSIQLTSDENGFIMKMVLNDAYDQLPEEQEYNLNLLEEDIKAVVFDNLNFRIEVCNANFVPIKNAE